MIRVNLIRRPPSAFRHEAIRAKYSTSSCVWMLPGQWETFLASFGRGYEQLPGVRAVQLGGDVDRHGRLKSPPIVVKRARA